VRPAPHPFSLRQLQYLVAVAEARSFRGAAALCRVSQPSLSAQIAALERALGVRLYERDRRNVRPTAAGQELCARAGRVLVEADDVLEASVRLGDPLAGTLRLGVLPTIAPYLLPEVVPALRRRHPRLDLRWTEEKTEGLIAALRGGGLDAALLALEARLGELERAVIGPDPFVLAAAPDHPLVRGRGPLHLGDLGGARVLLLDEGHCLREQALAVCAAGKAEEQGFRATSLGTLAQMVAQGAGVTLLPALAVAVEAQRAGLATRRFAAPAPHRTLGLCWRRNAALAPALAEVAGTLRAAWRRPARSLRPADGK
jgi:LysR family hydrogen peroxide-inducible transcriptional activator